MMHHHPLSFRGARLWATEGEDQAGKSNPAGVPDPLREMDDVPRGEESSVVSQTEAWIAENPALAAAPVLLGGVAVFLALAAIIGGLTSDGGSAAGVATSAVTTGAGTLAAGGLSANEVRGWAALCWASRHLTAGALAQVYDPRTFQPVCGVSDVVYRYLQGSALALVGRENYEVWGGGGGGAAGGQAKPKNQRRTRPRNKGK